LTTNAERVVASITDQALESFIWQPAFDPAQSVQPQPGQEALVEKLRAVARQLIRQPWHPLLMPAGKAPEEARIFFNDPSQTLYSLLLARPFLDRTLQNETDQYLGQLTKNMPRSYELNQGESRVCYDAPLKLLKLAEEPPSNDLARLYPLWLWSRTPSGQKYVQTHWSQLRSRLQTPASKSEDDCGNGRLAGLIAFCRMAREMKDTTALDQAMRTRLVYELAHTRGGVIRELPRGGLGFVRWRHLTPDVACLLAAYAKPITARLMADYADYQRPCWWMAWNVEQLMRNEVPYQMPSTPMEIFSARALILQESPEKLSTYLDLPWCRADEYYLQKLALVLGNKHSVK
jgi:hypothetical protein